MANEMLAANAKGTVTELRKSLETGRAVRRRIELNALRARKHPSVNCSAVIPSGLKTASP